MQATAAATGRLKGRGDCRSGGAGRCTGARRRRLEAGWSRLMRRAGLGWRCGGGGYCGGLVGRRRREHVSCHQDVAVVPGGAASALSRTKPMLPAGRAAPAATPPPSAAPPATPPAAPPAAPLAAPAATARHGAGVGHPPATRILAAPPAALDRITASTLGRPALELQRPRPFEHAAHVAVAHGREDSAFVEPPRPALLDVDDAVLEQIDQIDHVGLVLCPRGRIDGLDSSPPSRRVEDVPRNELFLMRT